MSICLFIYLGFYVAFNTVHVISRQVVGRAEETSTYSWSRFCTVKCLPTANNYQLFHLRQSREPNPSLRGGRRECYHSATVAPRNEYMGPVFKLSYPSVDTFTGRLRKLRRGALMHKIDLSHAFRQLEVEPADYPLLCSLWQGEYCVDGLYLFGHSGVQWAHRFLKIYTLKAGILPPILMSYLGRTWAIKPKKALIPCASFCRTLISLLVLQN